MTPGPASSSPTLCVGPSDRARTPKIWNCLKRGGYYCTAHPRPCPNIGALTETTTAGPAAKGTSAPGERVGVLRQGWAGTCSGHTSLGALTAQPPCPQPTNQHQRACRAGRERTGRSQLGKGSSPACWQGSRTGRLCPGLPGQRRHPQSTQGCSRPAASGSWRARNAILWSSLRMCSTGGRAGSAVGTAGTGRVGWAQPGCSARPSAEAAQSWTPWTPSSATAPNLACAKLGRVPPRGDQHNSVVTLKTPRPVRILDTGANLVPLPAEGQSSHPPSLNPPRAAADTLPTPLHLGMYNSKRCYPKCCTFMKEKVIQMKCAYFS